MNMQRSTILCARSERLSFLIDETFAAMFSLHVHSVPLEGWLRLGNSNGTGNGNGNGNGNGSLLIPKAATPQKRERGVHELLLPMSTIAPTATHSPRVTRSPSQVWRLLLDGMPQAYVAFFAT
jgi:hypothetical protein